MNDDGAQPVPAEDADEPRRELVDAVSRYDEELRCGEIRAPASAVFDATLRERALFGCLDLLERAWPRADGPVSGAQPQRIGKFQIERILGQGGFGIVYLARDSVLGRTVALKVPRLHTLTSRSLLERFQREARAAAALDHPQIVPLLEAGNDSGLYFIASAYCPGPNLGQWLRDHPRGVAPQLAARIVASIADAVEYSHARGILHRDIKPGNIMLAPCGSGELVADDPANGGLPFTPRLGDFGLAKIRQEAVEAQEVQDETAGTTVLGTPTYMAPEQLTGLSEDIGPATDIYALGVVLYELLVGRPPFSGTNVVDVLDQVRACDPVAVRRLRRDVPRDLETICLRCLTRSPAQRYSSAGALRDDLQRFLEGRSIEARAADPLELAGKWMRRHPAGAALAVTMAVFVLTMGIVQAWHAARLESKNEELRSALRQIKEETARAVAREQEARGIAYALDTNAAWRAHEEGDFAEFSRIIDRYRDGTPLSEYRGTEWHYLERSTRASGERLLELPTATYDIVDGPGGSAALVGEDAVVRLLQVETGVLVDSWPTGQVEVNSACFMPDGRSMWTAGDDGTVRRWDLSTHEELQRIEAHPDAKVFKVKYCQALQLLLTCGTDGPIRLWDVGRGGEPAGVLEGHSDWVQDLVLLPDGRRVVSASDDFTVRVWDLASRRELRRQMFDDSKMRDLALSPDGRTLAVCSQRLVIFDLMSESEVLELPILDESRLALFSDDGQRLYVADRMGVVFTFDLEFEPDGQAFAAAPLTAWQAEEGGVYALFSTADGRSVLTAGRKGRVSRWDGIGVAPLPQVIGHPDVPYTLAFHPQGRWLVVGGPQTLSAYDFTSVESAPIVIDSGAEWTAVDVDSQGTMIAGGTIDGRVRVFGIDADGFRPLSSFDCASDMPVEPLSFSCDGRALAVTNRDRHVQVFDPRTGVELQRMDVGQAARGRMSPVENVLAVSQANQSVALWDWENDRILWESPAFARRPQWIVFSPDGSQVLVNTDDRTVRVLDRATGRIVRELGQHRTDVGRIAMSPDGRTVVTKCLDGGINLWHAESGQLLFSLQAEHGGGYDEVAFSPDGGWLAYRANARDVHLLPMHP